MFALLAILMSCNKSQDLIDKADTKYSARENNIENAPYEEQIIYTKENLRIITLEIAKLAQDKSFRDFVREESSKKFDTEYEVLINDLMKNSVWQEALSNPDLQIALENFKGIDKNNYYPHIYIPKMQKREDDGLTANEVKHELINNDQIPLFVFSSCDGIGIDIDNPDILQGYRLSSNNTELSEVSLVDEEYANSNEVWVVALNESVRNIGNAIYLMTDLGNLDPNTGGGGSGSSGNNTGGDIDPSLAARVPFDNSQFNDPTVNCKIDYMIVKSKKESWFSGASEVSIKAVLTSHNGRINGYAYPTGYYEYQSDREGDRRGHLIDKFKVKEIKNWVTKNVNFSLQTNWPYGMLRDPAFYDFYIFEADKWPADVNTITTYRRDDYRYPPYSLENPFNSFWQEEYRSEKRDSDPQWNTPYIQSAVCNSTLVLPTPNQYYASGRFKQTNQIDFSTVGY